MDEVLEGLYSIAIGAGFVLTSVGLVLLFMLLWDRQNGPTVTQDERAKLEAARHAAELEAVERARWAGL